MSSLDNARKAAKRWLKAVRANDPEAHARLRRAHPHAPATPGLRDVQHALSLERGFASWAALKSHSQESGLADLLAAAGKGDLPELLALLDRHPAIINARGDLPGHTGSRTALHFGIRHASIVRALLERGADPNIRDDGDNAMPLHFAAENQDLPIIRLLIEHGADPIGAGDGHELEIIGWACCWDYREANQEVVDYLLAHGARHHIFSAVTMGEVEIVRALVAHSPGELERCMDETNRRRTPLHQAVIKKQPGSLAALLDLGADTEALDAAGLTPLDQAALNRDLDLAQRLIDRGARVQLPAAIALERSREIERLLKAEPDCLKPGQRYGHLILRAAERSPGHIVEALIRAGAAVNIADDRHTSIDGTGGYTPLHAAAFNGNADAVAVLIQHGANVNAREDKYCSTPAGWANYAGHGAVRDLIVEGPIDIFQAIELDRPDRIAEILRRDPGAITRPFREYATCEPKAASLTPLEAAELANKAEAARVLRDYAGDARNHRAGSHAERVAAFLEFACWDHRVHGRNDHRMHDRAAQRLLARHPEITDDSIYTTVVCGDLARVERLLAEDPERARTAGGSRGWTPLLYLSFARFSHPPAIDNAVAIARALLDRGANPNDFYQAGDSRYTALVGVAREGEQDAPPHPHREALFRLLLERGAEMYDIQVLYNTHVHGDVLWWLELVYAQSVKAGRRRDWEDPNWSMLDMGGYGPGARYLLGIAVEKNNVALAVWLLEHGASPNAVNPSHHREIREIGEGITGRPRRSGNHREHPGFAAAGSLYAEAVRRGHSEVADLLRRYGAAPDVPALMGEEAFVDACLRLDRDALTAQLSSHPEYLASPRAMFAAARHDRADVVELLLELGVSIEIEGRGKQRPLHEAAAKGSLRVAKLLIDRGADIDPRDAQFGSTPIGWASHADQTEMVEFLSRYSRNVWTLARRGYVDRLREVLDAEPERAKALAPNGTTPLWWLPDDEAKALAIVELFLTHGADRAARNTEGTTAADWARKRGMVEVARRLETE